MGNGRELEGVGDEVTRNLGDLAFVAVELWQVAGVIENGFDRIVLSPRAPVTTVVVGPGASAASCEDLLLVKVFHRRSIIADRAAAKPPDPYRQRRKIR
jgi:hypothetical protein